MASDRALSSQPINAWYDSRMYHPLYQEFYEGSDFANHGYWDAGTRSVQEACNKLMDQLLALLPLGQGNILDVACGKGATTQYLLSHYPADQVVGVNISEKQLATARENVPGVQFLLMDATDLEFEDNSFDSVLCVEAAFHFNTRERFLAEARRVLKPGGRLALSDILVTREAERPSSYRYPENYVANPEDYRQVLGDAGFVDVNVIDATGPCWHDHFVYLTSKYHALFVRREITFERMQEILSKTYARVPDLNYYLLAGMTKPA